MNFQYNFRIGPELLWAVGVAAAVPLLQALVDYTGVAQITPEFIDGVVAGIVRAVGGALLAIVTGGGFQKPGEPGPDPQ